MLEPRELPAGCVARLRAHLGAYYLGNTAGDVQTVTGQPRIETHHYRLKHLRDAAFDAVAAMLTAYPQLADPYALDPAHAAFLSGYWLHLIWDEVWAREVFMPLYYDAPRWPDWQTRVLHHNALRVILDQRAQAALRDRPEIVTQMREARPTGWLPFAPDAALRRWRDWLTAQLADPEEVETQRVFAARMEVSEAQFAQVVDAVRTDAYQPPVQGLHEALARFERRARARSRRTLLRYWRCDATLDGGAPDAEGAEADEGSIEQPTRRHACEFS
jgi:hypothetical protein